MPVMPSGECPQPRPGRWHTGHKHGCPPRKDPGRDAVDDIFLLSRLRLEQEVVFHCTHSQVLSRQSTMSSRDSRSALASAASTSALPLRLPASICDT